MFGRALKYDMKAVWKLWWVIAVSVGGLTVIRSFILRFVLSFADKLDRVSTLVNVVWGIAVFFLCVSFVAIFASSAGTLILVLVRFYKNFFTDEGYLTFTLPVSRGKLFLAKMTNAMIWTTLHNILLIICVMVMMLIALPPQKGEFINPAIYTGIGELLGYVFEGITTEGIIWISVYAVEALLALTVYSSIGICMLHMCITIGAVVAKKAKVITGIGIYYGIQILFSTAISLLANLFIFGMIGGFSELISKIETESALFAIIAVIGLLVIGLLATVALTIYFVTLDLIKNRLNLA